MHKEAAVYLRAGEGTEPVVQQMFPGQEQGRVEGHRETKQQGAKNLHFVSHVEDAGRIVKRSMADVGMFVHAKGPHKKHLVSQLSMAAFRPSSIKSDSSPVIANTLTNK